MEIQIHRIIFAVVYVTQRPGQISYLLYLDNTFFSVYSIYIFINFKYLIFRKNVVWKLYIKTIFIIPYLNKN